MMRAVERTTLGYDNCLRNLLSSLPELIAMLENIDNRVGLNAFVDCERKPSHEFFKPVPTKSYAGMSAEEIREIKRKADKERWRTEHPGYVSLEERTARQNAVIEDFNSNPNISVPDLAKKHGFTEEYVYQLVGHVDRRSQKSQELHAAIINDYKSGMAPTEIIKKHNVSDMVVYRTLQTEGLGVRESQRAFHRQVEADYNAGMSYIDIARKYDKDYKTIYNIIWKALNE